MKFVPAADVDAVVSRKMTIDLQYIFGNMTYDQFQQMMANTVSNYGPIRLDKEMVDGEPQWCIVPNAFLPS